MDWTSLLSDLITPAATLGGVVLTLIFTGRREERRAKTRSEEDRIARLFDSRREVFIRYLAVARRHESIVRQSMTPDAEAFEGLSEEQAAWGEIEAGWTELHLLAPTLDRVLSVHRSIREEWLGTIVRTHPINADRVDVPDDVTIVLADEFSGVVDSIEWNMRVSLGSLGDLKEYFNSQGVEVQRATRLELLRSAFEPRGRNHSKDIEPLFDAPHHSK